MSVGSPDTFTSIDTLREGELLLFGLRREMPLGDYARGAVGGGGVGVVAWLQVVGAVRSVDFYTTRIRHAGAEFGLVAVVDGPVPVPLPALTCSTEVITLAVRLLPDAAVPARLKVKITQHLTGGHGEQCRWLDSSVVGFDLTSPAGDANVTPGVADETYAMQRLRQTGTL